MHESVREQTSHCSSLQMSSPNDEANRARHHKRQLSKHAKARIVVVEPGDMVSPQPNIRHSAVDAAMPTAPKKRSAAAARFASVALRDEPDVCVAYQYN